MSELFQQLSFSANENLSVGEGIVLLLLAVVVWFNRKRIKPLPALYSIFLILYITLLRRAPGYDENIRLHLKLLPNAGVWAGNLLNLILYIPLGWTMKQQGKKAVVIAFILSVFCELMQYATSRGWADVNDILFNTFGATIGVWAAKKVSMWIDYRYPGF